MKTHMITRYVGSIERWLEFWKNPIVVDKIYASCRAEDVSWYQKQLNEIWRNLANNRQLYNEKIQQYPFDIPMSFRHMWLSGSVDIFEVLNHYWFSYYAIVDDFERTTDLHYFKSFVNPSYIVQFKDIPKYKRKFDVLCSIHPFMAEREELSIESDINPTAKAFYTYPNDEYVNPLSLKKSSSDEMFLICEGEIEVDHGALFLFADEPFSDGECEVGVWSYSESSWERYQTIPEPFLYNLAYFLFGAQVHSVDELIQVNDVFNLLYK